MKTVRLITCLTSGLVVWTAAIGRCAGLEGIVHVIGDSHTQEFSLIEGCKIHYLGPRTMHRVGRDGLALVDFRQFGVEEGDVVILVFGEIDVRCHIGKQRDLFHRNLDEIIDLLLDRFFHTILLIRCANS